MKDEGTDAHMFVVPYRFLNKVYLLLASLDNYVCCFLLRTRHLSDKHRMKAWSIASCAIRLCI
jgi:hypothetical protein